MTPTDRKLFRRISEVTIGDGAAGGCGGG